jgi:hypothetical protein
MKAVVIRSSRDIWLLNSYTGRTELLKAGVHTKVGEADYASLAKMFGSEIKLIEEPKSEEAKEEVKTILPIKRRKKSK